MVRDINLNKFQLDSPPYNPDQNTHRPQGSVPKWEILSRTISDHCSPNHCSTLKSDSDPSLSPDSVLSKHYFTNKSISALTLFPHNDSVVVAPQATASPLPSLQALLSLHPNLMFQTLITPLDHMLDLCYHCYEPLISFTYILIIVALVTFLKVRSRPVYKTSRFCS